MHILAKRFLAAVAAWRSLSLRTRRRLLVAGLVSVQASFIFIALYHEVLLTRFARQFRVDDPVARSDAIVVMLGSAYDRSRRAAELYRQGVAPIMLMGQTEILPFDETDNNRQVLMSEGVPSGAIRILPGEVVKSTHDEALRVRDYVRTHRVGRITVVTTAQHTARTRWTFRRVLQGTRVDVRMTASQDPRFTEADWYSCDIGRRLYFGELIRTIYYRIVY